MRASNGGLMVVRFWRVCSAGWSRRNRPFLGGPPGRRFHDDPAGPRRRRQRGHRPACRRHVCRSGKRHSRLWRQDHHPVQREWAHQLHRGLRGNGLVDGPRGTIKGITVVNSEQITIYTDDFTLEDCVFKGFGQYNQPLLDIYHCRPTLANCTFRDRSGDDGGVMACRGRSPTIRGCTFENNSASLDAGAILNLAGSRPVITECRFVNNSCKDDGGAIANYEGSHPIIVACTFERNRSDDNGGAIFSRSGSCPRIVSCLFAGNTARSNGGAIYHRENAAAIVNCVFTGNSAHDNGGAIYSARTDELPSLLNCTLVGNSAELEGGASTVTIGTVPTCSTASSGPIATRQETARPARCSQPPRSFATAAFRTGPDNGATRPTTAGIRSLSMRMDPTTSREQPMTTCDSWGPPLVTTPGCRNVVRPVPDGL